MLVQVPPGGELLVPAYLVLATAGFAVLGRIRGRTPVPARDAPGATPSTAPAP